MQHLERDEKAAAHIRNSGLRLEILFGSFFTPRASAENPVLSQATAVISLLGWQTDTFASAIPNAWSE